MKKLATALAVAAIGVAANAADLLYADSSYRLVEDNDRLTWVTCHTCGNDARAYPVKLAKGVNPATGQLRAAFAEQNLLVFRVDGGTACPAGYWFTVNTEKLIALPLFANSCEEISSVSYSVEGKAVTAKAKLYSGKVVSAKL